LLEFQSFVGNSESVEDYDDANDSATHQPEQHGRSALVGREREGNEPLSLSTLLAGVLKDREVAGSTDMTGQLHATSNDAAGSGVLRESGDGEDDGGGYSMGGVDVSEEEVSATSTTATATGTAAAAGMKDGSIPSLDEIVR
jgi:hypothetical protein